jgi:Carboxypeptidase regulatory-like domain
MMISAITQARPFRALLMLSLSASLLILSLPATARAQFDRGQISGVVRDAVGGVVPGVTVTAVNTQTNISQTVVTDASGFYIFATLAPGLYDVSAELQGFKRAVRNGLRVDAAAAVSYDVTLEPGAITEQVTVVGGPALLTADTGVRKTIEAKDIETLMLNGRDPLALAMLKPGVVAGGFNDFSFDNFHRIEGFTINGARNDENLVTVDGGIALRTRSSGAMIGLVNADAIQEVQVLTANYLPEYGRASGAQIRFVTKSGGSEFRGTAYEYFRDESLDANSWSRNRSPDAEESGGPAPFSFNQYGFTFGGPLFVPNRFNTERDKLFFFWSEEWVRFRETATEIQTVPSERMRTGDFGELLDPNNQFFDGTRLILDPRTGRPFANNVIPSELLSPNGMAFLNAYPAPTPGFRQGSANWIGVSPAERDQRKDNIRIDYRLNASNQFSGRWSHYDYKALDAFREGFPFARTDWDRPNNTAVFNWTSTIRNNLLNEFTYGYSKDEVFINVFEEGGLYQRSRYGITYPYLFPGIKEIEDKIPTISIDNFGTIDGGPYPASSVGPIHTWSNNVTWTKGRHTLKGGVFVEYSGEDDFDQINVVGLPGDTNNQNGRFEFRDDRPAGTGLAIANAAMGLFTNYAEIGQRSLTKWRSLGLDLFAQDTWRPTDDLTIDYGVRWSLWPPWYAQLNNAAMFDPEFYDPTRAVAVDPQTGAVVPGTGDPYNGVVLPGDGWPDEARQELVVAQDPQFDRLFHGLPRGFSETHANVFEPRFGVSWAMNKQTIVKAGAGIFHTRLTLNDSTLLGGNPPVQVKVGVSNGSADNPGGGQGNSFPLVMTAQDRVFKHPTAYELHAGVQRELPFGFVADVAYVFRRGVYLQRERNLNQLGPGTLQANPGVNANALRPYVGFASIRLSENAGRSLYNSLQVSVDRRYEGGLKVGAAYTFSQLKDNGDGRRDLLYNTYDDRLYYGLSGRDRPHVVQVYYIYDLPFLRDQQGWAGQVLGGWSVSGVVSYLSGTPFFVRIDEDIAGVGDSTQQPLDLVGDPDATNPGFSEGAGNDDVYWFNPNAFARPAQGTFGNQERNILRHPGSQNWDIALFKNFSLGGSRRIQFRAEAFNFINHPNLGEAESDPNNANFGRVTGKTGQRNVQLSLRFSF